MHASARLTVDPSCFSKRMHLCSATFFACGERGVRSRGFPMGKGVGSIERDVVISKSTHVVGAFEGRVSSKPVRFVF